jgi:hypothetical protein
MEPQGGSHKDKGRYLTQDGNSSLSGVKRYR